MYSRHVRYRMGIRNRDRWLSGALSCCHDWVSELMLPCAARSAGCHGVRVGGEGSDGVVGTTSDGYVVDDGRCLRYRLTRRQLRVRRVFLAVPTVLWVALMVAVFVTGDFGALISTVPWLLIMWWQYRRIRRATIGPEGIRPPSASRFTPWAAVEHVRAPGRFASTVTVRLTDQNLLDTGFPASCADRIADIGSKSIVSSPRPKPPAAPTHRRHPEVTITERAAALRKRNAELLDGIQRPHDDKPSSS